MPTHYKGKKSEVNALNVYIKLIRAAESITARVHAHIYEKGITVTQFSVLEALYHLGPLYQKELGDKLLKSGGNITLVIDNLEKQGLVRRERGSRDRRQFIIHLTDAGKEKIESIFPKHAEAITKEFEILTEEERTELERLLKIIGLKKRF